MAQVLLANDALDGARILAQPEAVTQWEARGWVALGPCSDPFRDPLRTDVEQADHDAAQAARLAALSAAPESDAAPATSRPKK